MSFDFSKAVQAANAITNKTEGGDAPKSYKYPLVYPSPNSTLVVRPVFNPKSGQIIRLVNRHEKTACYRTYGIECPICKVQQQVKDMTGQDPFGRKMASRSRGICFAQFISSTTPIKKADDSVVQPGEFILLMFPWSVYTQINSAITAIAQSPTGMDQAFCHSNNGFYIQIQVSNDFKYTTTQNPYMTFDSGMTDEQFMAFLEGMDDLNEQVIPSEITEDVDKQVKEYADAIYREFITPKVPNQGTQNVAPTPMAQAIPQQPTMQTPTPTQPQVTRPTCFGNHENSNPKCICCPDEMTCMNESVPF